MSSGSPSVVGTKAAIFLLFFLTCLAAAAPAAADRLELAAQLDGWNCERPSFLVGSADGLDLYVGGMRPNSSSCLGFVWFRRDPSSGRLKLMRLWGQRELGNANVRSLALSPDGRHLYAGVNDHLWIFERGVGGDLQKIGELPTYELEVLVVSPDGSELWAMGHRLDIYTRSANGFLTYKQFLPADLRYLGKPVQAFITADYAFAGTDFFRRQGGVWSHAGYARESEIGSVAVGAGGRYLYLSARISGSPYLVTYDLAPPTPAPVSQLRLGDGYEGAVGLLARDPRNGEIYGVSSRYVAPTDYRIALRRFQLLEGGRALSPAPPSGENAGGTQLLAFSADGRHLYWSFDDEPVALIRLPPSGPVHVPEAADPASRFRLPYASVAAGNGDLYVTVRYAIQLLRRSGTGLEIAGIFDFDDWPGIGPIRSFTLALSPDGRLAAIHVLSSPHISSQVALADRDLATGELRLRPETVVAVSSADPDLDFSPDGRFLYLSGGSRIDLLRVERSPPGLLPHASFPVSYGTLAIAPSGRDAFVGGQYYRRDPATGLLTEAPDLTEDWDHGCQPLFSRDGHLLVVRSTWDLLPRLRTFERSGEGWRHLGDQPLPESVIYTGMLVDPHGRRLFLPAGINQEPYTSELQLWEWDSGAAPFRFAGRVGPLLLNDSARGDAPYYSLSSDGNDLYAATTYRNLLRVFRAKCEPGSAYSACLGDGRYRVEIDWRDAAGAAHPALPTRIGSDDSRLFTFFDADNWEVLTKVLDGCGINQRVWVYSAATTDVGNTLRVTDTWSGRTAVYDNPAGTPAAAITDGDALDVCAVPSPGWVPVADTLPPVVPAGELLEVQNGRFEVSATWVTAGGQRGNARSLSARTAAAGLFYFFSPENWEIQAKVLDGCAINDRFWFFAAATTDVGYTLSVRDRQTGRLKTYQNPVGRAAPAITDIEAFACP